MKLPSRVRTGVQSLGRQSVSAPVAVATAQAGAIGTLTSGLSAVAKQQQQAKSDAQIREASLRMSDNMAEFEKRYGNRESYSADELPESLQVRKTEKVVGPDGSVSEVPRSSIPAYEVQSELYKIYASNVAEASASIIDDEEARANWATRASMGINDSYVSRLSNDRQQQERYIASQLDAQIMQSVDSGQHDTALVLAEDIKDPAQRAKTVRGIKRDKELSGYHGLLAAETDDIGVIREMEQAISDLQSEDYSGNLNAQERSAMVAQMKSATARNYLSVEATKQRGNEALVSGTWENIIKDDPETNENTVNSLFSRGIISGNTRTSMIRALVSNREQAIRNQVVNIDLDTIAMAPYGIDPKDNDMRKAVDKRYDAYTQSMQPGEAAARIMREFKAVPGPVQSIFRANNRADARGLADAAQMYSDAMKYAPQSMKDFKDADLDVISRVAANIDLGMSPGDAIEAVRMWESMTPQQRAALEKNNKVFEEENVSALESKIGDSEMYQGGGIFGFFRGVPDVPPLMQSEYSSAVEKYLPSVGYSVQVAQQMAFQDISKKWHRTEINGKPELMKNAPQGPVDSVQALRDATYADSVKELSSTYGADLSTEDVKIVPDQLTAIQIERGDKPSYRAYVVVDKETQQVHFLDRFVWDGQAAAESRRSAILEKAQIDRDSAREASARALEMELNI